VLLPLSENPNLSWKYGTRHRAALGLSEISDSRCIVISEETGSISLVYGGNLEKVATIDDLRAHLEQVYGITVTGEKGPRKIPFADLLSTDLFQKFFAKNAPQQKKTGKASYTAEDRTRTS
jgi:hypothetical protein